MLDIHSHFLPKMDDGSKSVEMSLEMLRSSKAQGVTTMVSTSHFYGSNEDPEHFLKRREKTFSLLEPHLTEDMPDIYFGAEILYYPGISQSDVIQKLKIEGTDLILIELPFVEWSDKIFEELITLQYYSSLRIILAHIERYQSIQRKRVFESVFDQPFYFQCNAEAFESAKSRKLALKMIDSDRLHFLGTDCHNTSLRPPNMDEARRVIEKKLSPGAWKQLNSDFEHRFNRHKISD